LLSHHHIDDHTHTHASEANQVSSSMAIFPSKKFRPSSYDSTVAAKYRNALARHPFALFGLPFIATMVLGSFFLTPATALRFERHDRKVRQVSKEEELGIGKDRRKIDMKEEYYVSSGGDLISYEKRDD